MINRRAKHTERARTVPAGLVILGVSGIADARDHLEAENEGVQKISAGYLVGAGRLHGCPAGTERPDRRSHTPSYRP